MDMNKKSTIVVKNRVKGLHLYDGAPEGVEFLKHEHRHLFYVETEIEVFHDDRELEFFLVQDAIDDQLAHLDLMNPETTMSCEMIADHIACWARYYYGSHREVTCTVYEDNENGGRVQYKRG